MTPYGLVKALIQCLPAWLNTGSNQPKKEESAWDC